MSTLHALNQEIANTKHLPSTPLKKTKVVVCFSGIRDFFNVLGGVIAQFSLNFRNLKVHISLILDWFEIYACTTHTKIHHSFLL